MLVPRETTNKQKVIKTCSAILFHLIKTSVFKTFVALSGFLKSNVIV